MFSLTHRLPPVFCVFHLNVFHIAVGSIKLQLLPVYSLLALDFKLVSKLKLERPAVAGRLAPCASMQGSVGLITSNHGDRMGIQP